MLYYLLYPFHESFTLLNVFRYITFRTAAATLTAMLISFVLGPWIIRRLADLQVRQTVREEGPKRHQVKTGTPTMGGIIILSSVVIPVLLWAKIANPLVLVVLFSIVAFGILGFVDDYLKISRKKNEGLSGRLKMAGQLAISLGIASYLFSQAAAGKFTTELSLPFFKQLTPDLGLLFIPFAMLVITGSSNAVNLTDGLDGLAIGSTLIATAVFTVLAYIAGNAVVSSYLHIANIPGSGEVTVICGALIGACLGFLWFNAHPAQIFMGDIGSLALGGAIGTVAVVIRQELMLLIAGGLFVMEALSVIIQVVGYKWTGKRVFRMAPIHHHFELKGWSEPQVVIRFWILAIIFALVAMSTLKLR
jgi:phospho-N-acetylmuramoyl-pentapeptide-transferase